MDAEMESTIVILWLAGVVCGAAFFTGLCTFVYFLWKKDIVRLTFSFIAIGIGLYGMSYSIFTILRDVRSWVAN